MLPPGGGLGHNGALQLAHGLHEGKATPAVATTWSVRHVKRKVHTLGAERAPLPMLENPLFPAVTQSEHWAEAKGNVGTCARASEAPWGGCGRDTACSPHQLSAAPGQGPWSRQTRFAASSDALECCGHGRVGLL